MTIFEITSIPFNSVLDEVCCGYPLWQQGRDEEAKDVLSKNLTLLKKTKGKRLVFSCPSCYRMFKEIAPDLGLDVPFELLHVVEFFRNKVQDKIISQ